MSFDMAELKRSFASMISVGIVVESKGSKARVSLDGGDIISDFLPVISKRSHNTKILSSLEVGEQVLILSPGEINSGFILGSIFMKDQEPVNNTISFKDGTIIGYDEDSKKISIKGSHVVLEIEAKEVSIKSSKALISPAPEAKIVTTNCICAFTGTPHPVGDPSLSVKGSL